MSRQRFKANDGSFIIINLCQHYSKVIFLIILSMKRVIDIRTIQFTNPQTSAEDEAKQRQRIINQTANSHFLPIDHALRGSKISRKAPQNQKRIFKDRQSTAKGCSPQRHRGERDRLCKSQNGRRSLSRGRQRYSESQQSKIPKSNSISRYQTRKDGQQFNMEQGVRHSFHITSHTRRLFAATSQLPKERMKTEPSNCINLKSQLMRRICKKITFMKKMTSESNPPPISITDPAAVSPSKSLFRFDKFYEHCVKNINRCINIYQKDITKEKDKKYFQLKVEGGILAKELMEIRNQLIQKEKQVKSDHNFGVVGSGIEVKNFQKIQSHRLNSSHYKKKVKKINKNIYEQMKNPFKMDDMHGWQFGLQRAQDFYI